MTISDLFSLLGGLGLFLYGMDMMCRYLQRIAQGKMQEVIGKMTASTTKGFLAGTVITAILQSSSAITVLMVGMVNAGILSMRQTVGVILGANIGTTITGQLTAFRINEIAPLLAFVGTFLLLFCNKECGKKLGGMLAGLGFLFTGLAMMEYAMEPLGEENWLLELFGMCSNPAMGILVGTIFTAMIQSSSASVSILQTLAKCGLVKSAESMYIILGQNIGTCATALLASVKTNIRAKQTALLHVIINVLGAMIFCVLCQILPVIEWIEKVTPEEPARQIANMHTVFNVVTSLILLPFTGILVKIVEVMIPSKRSDKKC